MYNPKVQIVLLSSRFKDGKLNGKLKTFLNTGLKCGEANFKDGKLNGEITMFASNGYPYIKIKSEDGVLEGTGQVYDAEIGTTKYTQNYHMGLRFGEPVAFAADMIVNFENDSAKSYKFTKLTKKERDNRATIVR